MGTAQHPARRTNNHCDKGKSEVHSVHATRSTPPGPKSRHAAQTTCLPSRSPSSEWLDISLRSRRPSAVSNRSCLNVSKARCGVILSLKQDNRHPETDSSSRGQCPLSSLQENIQIFCLSHLVSSAWNGQKMVHAFSYNSLDHELILLSFAPPKRLQTSSWLTCVYNSTSMAFSKERCPDDKDL